MKVLKRLENSGKISPFARAVWVAAVATGKVTSILGIGVDFTTQEQKGLFNIARKVENQFGMFGNIAGKVGTQGSVTGMQIAGKVGTQLQLLPGIQIANNVTEGQLQVMVGVQIAGNTRHQGQAGGIQLAGTIDESQQQILGIQGSLRNNGKKEWGLNMMDNRGNV